MESKSKKKKLIVFSILACIFTITAIAIWYFVSKLNQPVTSTVGSSLGAYSSNYYNIDLTPVKRVGPYADFNSPKGLRQVSDSLISAISVEDFNFYVKDIYSWTLAIDIIKTPLGQLDESSSYNLRKNDPAKYSESSEVAGGQQISVMTDTSFPQGFSKVAYFTHGDLVGIVSLVGNDSSGNKPLVTTFNMVLDSWTWLQ